MLVKNPKKIESIFDLDIVFNNNEILKDFIIEIFEVCHEINEEISGKFGIVFLKKGINEYLLLDFRILALALFKFLEKIDTEIKDFKDIKKSFPFNNDTILNNSMINLLFILAKKNLVYFSDLKRYYTKYKLCISHNNFIYSTKFDGIAVKYPTIIKLFSNNKTLCKFEKLIIRDFEKSKNSFRIHETFSIENFSQLQNNF